MANGDIGFSWQPGAGAPDGAGGPTTGPTGRGLSPQQAVKILSLRIPERPSPRALAPQALLTSPGAQGPGLSSIIDQLMAIMRPQASPQASDDGGPGAGWGGAPGPTPGHPMPPRQPPPIPRVFPRVIPGDDERDGSGVPEPPPAIPPPQPTAPRPPGPLIELPPMDGLELAQVSAPPPMGLFPRNRWPG